MLDPDPELPRAPAEPATPAVLVVDDHAENLVAMQAILTPLAAEAGVRLVLAQSFARNVTINPGTTLTINGFRFWVDGASFVNNGTLVGTTASSGLVFRGSATSLTTDGIVSLLPSEPTDVGLVTIPAEARVTSTLRAALTICDSAARGSSRTRTTRKPSGRCSASIGMYISTAASLPGETVLAAFTIPTIVRPWWTLPSAFSPGQTAA